MPFPPGESGIIRTCGGLPAKDILCQLLRSHTGTFCGQMILCIIEVLIIIEIIFIIGNQTAGQSVLKLLLHLEELFPRRGKFTGCDRIACNQTHSAPLPAKVIHCVDLCNALLRYFRNVKHTFRKDDLAGFANRTVITLYIKGGSGINTVRFIKCLLFQ